MPFCVVYEIFESPFTSPKLRIAPNSENLWNNWSNSSGFSLTIFIVSLQIEHFGGSSPGGVTTRQILVGYRYGAELGENFSPPRKSARPKRSLATRAIKFFLLRVSTGSFPLRSPGRTCDGAGHEHAPRKHGARRRQTLDPCSKLYRNDGARDR